MTSEARAALAPTGTLRAGINLGNFLLVTDKTDIHQPRGVSPSLAAHIASLLDVPVTYVPYESPGVLADDSVKDAWDIGNIGAEPARAETINFTAAYVEIECTYVVPPGSPIQSIAEVDQPGKRIAVSARSAYDLWLERNIKHAELIRVSGLDASFDLFVNEGLDALAGLRPRLVDDVQKLDGARILEGKFSAVQQAVGTPKSRDPAALAFLRQTVEAAKSSGLVAGWIAEHGVEGRLSVAEPE
ncbi:MAG: transporter substrate-binding domain-containing protein [Pseudomonadota bacterium]